MFPMDCQSTVVETQDPHHREMGCYLVEGINLIAECTGGYDAVGLLLWLPRDRCYATWDSSHDFIGVFRPQVTWSQIAKAPCSTSIASGLACSRNSAPTSCLVPWLRHSYNAEQVHHPLRSLIEWYEATWIRRGAVQQGVQVRFPEEIRIRLEDNGEGCDITGQVKEMSEAEAWCPAVTRALTTREWEQVHVWLEADFWGQPKMGGECIGETATMWSFSGYRSATYRTLFRSYGDVSSEGDAVHELGTRLAKLARLEGFEAD